MKYVITGGAGNISKPLAETLLKAGHDVTVVGRSAENLQSLTAQGAKAAIGSVEDEAFVTKAFAGAEAVYLMIPPNFGAVDFRAYQNKVSDVYIKAVQENGISKIVLLSSIGAHMGNGAGPIDGLSDFEKKLSLLPAIDVKILRPSYFISNLFGMIPMIKGAGIMGSNIGTDEKLILVHPTDIAAIAAEELLALNFTGQTIRYIASDERKPEEIAAILSNAIGKVGIPWIDFTDEQTNEGMLQAGLLKTMADAYTEMGKALREGKLQEDYRKHSPSLGPTKLEDFAKEFAAAFNA